MTEDNAAPTDAQLIEWNRKTCPYFTIDRSRAVEWPHDLDTNKEAFAEMCGKSEVVFLRNAHWAVIIGSNYFAKLLDPIADYGLALDGHLCVMCGCKMVTDAFCEPVAKDPAPPAIYFIPREGVKPALSEQEIAEARKGHPFFTSGHADAVEWPHRLEGNHEAFAEMCRKSKVVFLRGQAWGDMIGTNRFADLLAQYTGSGSNNETLGTFEGCIVISDAFCLPGIKDETRPAISFIPREV